MYLSCFQDTQASREKFISVYKDAKQKENRTSPRKTQSSLQQANHQIMPKKTEKTTVSVHEGMF
jgi:hypothetical protein